MLTAGTRRHWRLAKPGPALPARPGCPPLVAQLLAQRGLDTTEAVDRFLQPRLTHLDDPADLPGCAAAAKRIVRAIADKQPVVIYGDYDVDGVTAAAILWHLLRHLGHPQVSIYIPHRLDEGYGLNAEALQQFARDAGDGPRPLVVTVDCGITAVAAAAEAKALGLELIITDHHHFDPAALPDAALVHPGLPDAAGQMQDKPSELCGAGVAFKLAWQVARQHCGSKRLPQATATLLQELLAYAALGTIADIVPLVGENRVITIFGLRRVKRTPFLGLNALIDAAELRDEKIDAYHVGFVLGPRLNACGRMGHARQAATLLTDASPAQAKELAAFLTKENQRRQATERQIFEQAVRLIEERGDDADDRRAIVVADEAWHPGVVGIVASRLVERFHRPAVVLGIDPDTGYAKGSARSVEGLDLHAALSEAAHHCLKFGGHAMAAGLTLEIDKLEAFRDDVIAAVNRKLTVDELQPVLTADLRVDLADCTGPLFKLFEQLAPFGRANPAPRLWVRGLLTARPAQRMGGNGKHLSVSLRSSDGQCAMRAVGFGLGDLVDELPAALAVEVLAKPTLNTWRGVTSPELHLLDIRPQEAN